MSIDILGDRGDTGAPVPPAVGMTSRNRLRPKEIFRAERQPPRAPLLLIAIHRLVEIWCVSRISEKRPCLLRLRGSLTWGERLIPQLFE